MSQVSLGRPEFVPGTPPGHPTAKFLYVIFLYRFSLLIQARKRHININFLSGYSWDDHPLCPRDKVRFSSYFTQWKPSLSLGQSRGRRAAEKVYVLKVCVLKGLFAFFARNSFPLKVKRTDFRTKRGIHTNPPNNGPNCYGARPSLSNFLCFLGRQPFSFKIACAMARAVRFMSVGGRRSAVLLVTSECLKGAAPKMAKTVESANILGFLPAWVPEKFEK